MAKIMLFTLSTSAELLSYLRAKNLPQQCSRVHRQFLPTIALQVEIILLSVADT